MIQIALMLVIVAMASACSGVEHRAKVDRDGDYWLSTAVMMHTAAVRLLEVDSDDPEGIAPTLFFYRDAALVELSQTEGYSVETHGPFRSEDEWSQCAEKFREQLKSMGFDGPSRDVLVNQIRQTADGKMYVEYYRPAKGRDEPAGDIGGKQQ